jgi:uncharacterized membrane protein YeaQ/YmgE (transglycosylase-associated protein family)
VGRRAFGRKCRPAQATSLESGNKAIASPPQARDPARAGNGNEGRGAMLQHSFFGWILIGLVAGVIGKLIMPGKDPGGFIVTILIGIAGALFAGFIAQALGWEIDRGWQSYAAAIAGAVVLLALYRLIAARRAG